MAEDVGSIQDNFGDRACRMYFPKDFQKNISVGLMVLLKNIKNQGNYDEIADLYKNIADTENIIIVVPNGVDNDKFYNNFAFLDNVKQLIVDFRNNFKINNVIVNGVSSSGYSALRLYDYCGELIDALCLMSIHYNEPELLGEKRTINYKEPSNIYKFKNTPMIIFHGSEDCQYEYKDVKEFFKELTDINSSVQVVIEEIDHCGMTQFRKEILSMWLKKLNQDNAS